MLFNFQGPSLYLAEVLAYFITPSLVCQALFSTFFRRPLDSLVDSLIIISRHPFLVNRFFEVFEVFSIFFFSLPTFQYLFDPSQRQLDYIITQTLSCQEVFSLNFRKFPLFPLHKIHSIKAHAHQPRQPSLNPIKILICK